MRLLPDSFVHRVNSCRSAKSRLAAFAAVLLCAGAAACADPAPAAQNEPPVDARQLFAQACAKCHGPDGAGGLPMADGGPKPIDLRDPQWQGSRSDAEITDAILKGRGAMPPFEGVLSSKQVLALVRHIRSLDRRDR